MGIKFLFIIETNGVYLFLPLYSIYTAFRARIHLDGAISIDPKKEKYLVGRNIIPSIE